ncbi:MAG: hypothetical protein WCA35_16805, partial [Kovacikia sp.]
RDALAEEFINREQLYHGEINQLNAALASANGIKRPKGNAGYPGWVANQVIDTLLEYKAPCDYVTAYKVEVADVAVISVELQPRDGVKVSQVEQLTKEIHARVGLGEPDIGLTDIGNIEIQFALVEPEQHRPTGEKENPIPEPHPTELRKALVKAVHYFISGDTGAGKSTLINNIACLVQAEYGEDIEIVIVDPKFPDSDWVIQGQRIVPQYKGYDRLTDQFGNELPNALDGLHDMHREVRDRLQLAAEAEIAGKPKPDRKPILYIIDEAEDLIATYSKEASEPILGTLRVGRSTKVIAVPIGQSPMCSDYGMKKANLNNCTRFWLRENAMKGLDDCSPPREVRAELKAQIYARQKRAQAELKEGLDPPPSGFYALFKVPGQPPFVASLPRPNQYAELVSANLFVAQRENEDIWDLVDQAEQQELSPEQEALNKLFNDSDRILNDSLTDNEREVLEYARKKHQQGKTVTASTIKANLNRFKKWEKEQIWEVFRTLTKKGFGAFDGTRFRPS